MTVSIYVPRDGAGKEWAPDHPHEVEPILGMLRDLWRAYHHLDTFYCVIANMRLPSADLTIITERGLGVVELKHHYGKIRIDKTSRRWYAGDMPIHAGSNANNPHEQVQAYAQSIRDKFLFTALPKELRRRPEELNEVKFQTAVCFTNPNADVRELKADIGNAQLIRRKPWESTFSVITPGEICTWAATLRFGVNLGWERGFEPLRLPPEIIASVAEVVFGGVAWTEAISQMPSGEAYGQLVLEQSGGTQVFNLVNDVTVIGRSPDCDIVLPAIYKRVSKRHCRIFRKLTTVFVEDLESTNGTYIDGNRLQQPTELQHGTVITLGGAAVGPKTCGLLFKLRSQKTAALSITEVVSTNERNSSIP